LAVPGANPSTPCCQLEAVPGTQLQRYVQGPNPSTPSWQIRAVTEDGKTRMVLQPRDSTSPIYGYQVTEDGKARMVLQSSDQGSRATFKSMEIKISGKDPLKLTPAGTQIQVKHPTMQACADTLCSTGAPEQFVLDGHVKLSFKKDGQQTKVMADRVLVNLADGGLVIESTADGQQYGTSKGCFDAYDP
jgi:hypothetical protein